MPNLTPSTPLSRSSSILALDGAAVVVSVLVVVVVIVTLCLCRRRTNNDPSVRPLNGNNSKEENGGAVSMQFDNRQFCYKELKTITNSFEESIGNEMEPPPSQQNITHEWSMECQCCSKGADLHLPVSLNKMDQRVVTMSSTRSASRWPSNCRCYYCPTCALSGVDAACCLPLEQARELLLAVRASFPRQKHQVAAGAGQGHDLPYLVRYWLGRVQAATTTYQMVPSRTSYC